MRRDELSALGDLAGIAASSIAEQAHDIHATVAARVFRRLGPSAIPVRAIHDRVSEAAYAGAAGLTGAIVRGGTRELGSTRPEGARSIDDTTSGRLVVGAINGAWGDALHQRRSPLAAKMTFRSRGRDLRSPVELADPTPRLALFIHGLCETDDAWRLGASRHAPYGDRLGSELGYTPLYLRYNSGLHISDNGRRLAAMLDELVARWPVPLHEIALFGHSMGGLVARSACHYGRVEGWRRAVRHVFTLGAPHRGAPLEQAANVACSALSLLPETRGFAVPLKARSAGIKDLRYGYLLDEDWLAHDADAFLHNTGREIPFLETRTTTSSARRCQPTRIRSSLGSSAICSSCARAPGRTAGAASGCASPSTNTTTSAARPISTCSITPAIYEHLKRWLTVGRALPAAAS